MPSAFRFSTPRKTDIRDLCRAIVAVQTEEDMEAFLQDLCADRELQILRDRWFIAKLMHMGFSYRQITRKTGASSGTISRIARNIAFGSGELLRACKHRQDRLAREFVLSQNEEELEVLRNGREPLRMRHAR
jgi:TrpR-related protein YerC/YecD